LTTSVCASSTHTCAGTPTACPNSTACADAASCGTKKIQGAPCTSTADCAAGTCVDNAAGIAKLCCATACSGACQACASDGSVCTTKNAGVADSACGTAMTCHTGTCAAGGTCQLSSPGTNCNGSLYCTAAGQCTCQGGGSCQPSNGCKTGTYSCATGTAQCTESGNQLATVSCGLPQSCTGSTKYLAQHCDGSGACSQQASQPCPTNQTCSGTDCACNSPNQTCSGACVSTNTDAANCGTCGHGCQGGTCSGGKCQPATLTSGLSGYAFVFGVDASYVYYNDCSDYYTCTPRRIGIGSIGGTGSALTSLTATGIGVIGNTMLLFQNGQGNFVCNIGTSCSNTSPNRFGSGNFGWFKSPAPSYFSLTDWANSSTETTTWYTSSNTIQTSFSWANDGTGVGAFGAVGNSVYWVSGNSTYSVWGTVGFPASSTRQMAGGITFYPHLVDATSMSLIYQDNTTKYLYRVPVSGGMGTGAPQNFVGATGTKFVTEDANGIYWIDSLGNLNRCSAPTCSGTTVMTTGQTLGNYAGLNDLGALYQDSTSLYWINGGSGQLLKLAK